MPLQECGNEWTITPNCLERGRGCPKCSIVKRSPSHLESSKSAFFSLMDKRDDITILGEYLGNKSGILVRCNKCQYEWTPTPQNLKNGSRCPKCMGTYSPTTEEFKEWLSNKRPELQALSPYISSSEKMKLKCTVCGHEWEAKPNSIKNGSGCPNCSHGPTSFVEQYIKASMEVVFGKSHIIHRDKRAIGKEIDIYIPERKIGIEYGAWYWHRNRIRTDEEKRLLAKNKGVRLITIYDSYYEEKTFPSDIITFSFSLGHLEHRNDLQKLIIFIVKECGTTYSFSLSDWEEIEDIARINSRKINTDQFIKDMQTINPTISILGEYKNGTSYLHVKCKVCGFEWDSKPVNLKQGFGCKKCGNVYSPTPQEFAQKIEESRSDVTILEPYVNNTTKILVKCNRCGRLWKVLPYSLLAGKKCSVCAGNYSPTTKEFILRMRIINPNIEVLGEYKNSHTHIACKCLLCNYEWAPTPHSLVSGSGCPKCSRKKTV